MKKCCCYILLTVITVSCFSQQLKIANLRCEYRSNPIGVDATKPRLSWELQSGRQNILQAAYRILVADNPSLLKTNKGNTWDSKKVLSGSSIQVEYNGKALHPAKKYYWKVMVWDNKGNVSSWSNGASWQMGLLTANDWGPAKWIGYEEINDTAIIVPLIHGNGKRTWGPRKNILPMFRKSFFIDKKIKNATAYICGLGQFELSVNGKKIGDHFLDPGWTDYSKHALYVTFDLTGLLKQGVNAFGVMLGNGFYYIPGQRYRKMTGAYGLPKMIMRTVIEYADGTIDNVISNENWKATPSPVIFSSIYGGEDYDATLEQVGWDTDNFKDDNWKNAIITKGPAELNSQMAEPVKKMDVFTAATNNELPSGDRVYDLGQNFSGIPSIAVSGKRGDTVRIIPAELVNEDGSANQRGSGGPSYFTYIMKGGGPEIWQPQFSFYGFRYLQVQCIAKDSLQKKPEVLNIVGLHMRNAVGQAGEFQSSSELFNRTFNLINWAIKSNTMSVFMDCPHREKLGWLEETHLMGSSVQYNFDIAAMCKKVIRDMMNAQHEDGKVPEIAPEFTAFTPPFDESPEWGSAAIILPWYNYQWYGDKSTLIEAYDMMKKYVDYLKNRSVDNILTHGLSDWYDIGPNRPGVSQLTPMGITATAFYYYDLSIMTEVATLLGKTADAVQFKTQADVVKKSFNERFFYKATNQYGIGSQASNAIALFMGLVEPQNKAAVTANLVNDIQSRNNALTAGDVGYRYVLRALEDAGRSDVIFDMNNRYDVPGYGYQLQHGATALTESWQAYPSVSNNHFMLGHLMEWFYAGLCGIKQAKDGVAYNKIEIRPQPVGDVTWAKGSYNSVYGLIKSEWKKSGGTFELNVTIPPNTTAEIYLPTAKNPVKTGSGKYKYTVTLK